MITIGLTGSIGMGKSTTAAMLRKMGCAVHSADAVVHRLLAKDGAAVSAVAALFPTTLQNGAINRQQLGAMIFPDPAKRAALEAILHPLVQAAEQEKRARAQAVGYRFLVLDIPLLFETGAEKRCDTTICVTARAAIQRKRVMARPNMTAEKFAAILSSQMPDAEKRRRADYVIHTDYGRCAAWWQLRCVFSSLAVLG